MANPEDSKKPVDKKKQITNMLTIPPIAVFSFICALLALIVKKIRRFICLNIVSMPVHRNRKVACVTGSGRGIGLEIVKKLIISDSFNGDVYLTEKSEDQGQKAADKIRSELQSKHNPKFFKLDIDDADNVKELRK